MQIKNIKRIILAFTLFISTLIMPTETLWAVQSNSNSNIETKTNNYKILVKWGRNNPFYENVDKETFEELENLLYKTYTTEDEIDIISLNNTDKFKINDNIEEDLVRFAENGKLPRLNRILEDKTIKNCYIDRNEYTTFYNSGKEVDKAEDRDRTLKALGSISYVFGVVHFIIFAVLALTFITTCCVYVR